MTFEPGEVKCEDCKATPEDPWDESPEGFKWFIKYSMWLCDDCRVRVVEDIEYGPKN